MRRRRKRGENGGAWGGAGEREAMRRRVGREYEMRAGERQLRLNTTSVAGLRDEGGLPTFSVRQQELGGKANLDGWRIPTARDNHSRTGWA